MKPSSANFHVISHSFLFLKKLQTKSITFMDTDREKHLFANYSLPDVDWTQLCHSYWDFLCCSETILLVVWIRCRSNPLLYTQIELSSPSNMNPRQQLMTICFSWDHFEVLLHWRIMCLCASRMKVHVPMSSKKFVARSNMWKKWAEKAKLSLIIHRDPPHPHNTYEKKTIQFNSKEMAITRSFNVKLELDLDAHWSLSPLSLCSDLAAFYSLLLHYQWKHANAIYWTWIILLIPNHCIQ